MRINLFLESCCDECGRVVSEAGHSLCASCRAKLRTRASQGDMFGFTDALNNPIPAKITGNKEMPLEEQIKQAELSRLLDKYQGTVFTDKEAERREL